MQDTQMTVLGDGGVRLAVRTFPAPGPNAPSLLLHHGLASSQHIWDLMLPALTKRFRVVTYDARGHGLSAKPQSGYGFAHIAADAVAVAGNTRLHRPVIVGHSWGAMTALEVVAAHPRRFGGAVLIDGGLVPVGERIDWATTKERLAPPRLSGMHIDEFRRLIRTAMGGSLELTPEIEDIVLAVMRVDREGKIRPRLNRANHFRILRAIWEQHPLAQYARLRVPTFVILAHRGGDYVDEADRAFVEAKRSALAQAKAAARGRDVRFTWMEGIHDLPLQHPVALARRIERFVSSAVG
ncbi:MAG: alpha/beta hydrolase [Actinomycetota bacterium]